jgi:hypothetical protein
MTWRGFSDWQNWRPCPLLGYLEQGPLYNASNSRWSCFIGNAGDGQRDGLPDRIAGFALRRRQGPEHRATGSTTTAPTTHNERAVHPERPRTRPCPAIGLNSCLTVAEHHRPASAGEHLPRQCLPGQRMATASTRQLPQRDRPDVEIEDFAAYRAQRMQLLEDFPGTTNCNGISVPRSGGDVTTRFQHRHPAE